MTLPWRHRIWQASTLALCAALAAPVHAASDHSSGDGSTTDNERLVPGLYPAEPVLDSGEWLREPYDPFFDVDWSVSLRGGYTKTTDDDHFETIVAPTVVLTHQGSRSAATFTGSAEIVRPSDGEIDVSGLRLGFDGGYALDSVTTLTASGSYALTQDVVGTPGLADTVAEAPQTHVGTGQVGITRQFGRFNVGLDGSVARTVYGPTTRTDGTLDINSDQNYWALDTNLRVGFQASPIFEVFGEAGLGRDLLDQPTPILLTTRDATDMSIRGGITGRWNSVLEATGSVGLARRTFDDPAIEETLAYLYDANVVFTPDPTWRLAAGVTTTVAPPGPDAPGNTRVEYGAYASADYTVNSWLALRALADWRAASFAGTTATETGNGWNLGADYAVNAHTDLSADYRYDFYDSTVEGAEEAHRVTVGITVSR